MAPALPNLSVLSSSLFFFSLVCLLKQSWTDSKDFFTIFCWPDHHLSLVMSADCLLGTLLADLLISVVPFLSVSVWRTCWCLSGLNLSVSLASVSPVSPVGVCLKRFPTSFAKSVWRDHLMSSWINPISFLPVSVWWVWSVSVRAGSHLSLSANVCCEEPADVCLNWTHVSSCQYLSSEFNRCLPEVFPNVCCQSVWRDHLMSSWINPMSFLPASVWWVWSVSVRAGSHLFLSANVC